jgi:hypothetical protein
VALLDEHVAALLVQVDVEEHDVDLSGLQLCPSGRERLRLAHLVALQLEVDPTEQPNRGFVVDDENPDRRRMPPGNPHLRASLNHPTAGP